MCIVGGANGQAPNPPVCDRTQQVQDAIVAAIGEGGGTASDCSGVTGVQLAAISGTLDLRNKGIEALKSDDFNGLTQNGLTLDLRTNSLQTLPADIFDGLEAVVLLNENPYNKGLPSALIDNLKRSERTVNIGLVFVQDILPTSPLALTVGDAMDIDLEDAFFYAVGLSRFSAKRYDITVGNESVARTSLSDHTLTITAASAGQTEIVIVGEQRAHNTLQSTAAQTLAVEAAAEPNPPVCNRTQEVQDAIVAAIGEGGGTASDCSGVTGVQLAAISGTLDLRNKGIGALRSGDFNGLTQNGLTLDLRTNSLQMLPADIFDGLEVAVLLNENPYNAGLPSALIDNFKRSERTVNIGLVFVQDILPDAPLALTVGDAMDIDLEDAFFYATGLGRFAAESYDITVGNESVARTSLSDHTLTITAASAGQTEIVIVGEQRSQSAFQSTAAQTLAVEVAAEPNPPVCNRTQQVQDAIVAAIGEGGGTASDCSGVTSFQLAAISGTLDLRNKGIGALRSDDFNGLTQNGLTLDLRTNSLQTLPADIFDGLEAVVLLNENPYNQGLPSALIDNLKRISKNVTIGLVFVQDILPTASLALTVGDTADINLEDAFFYAIGLDRLSAESYDITVGNESVARTSLSDHTLTITAASAGQTEIVIVGEQRSQSALQSTAVQTLAVEAAADELIFRIKVFLEGAQ